MAAQRRRFRLAWYNGFSPDERLEMHWAFLDAYEAGRLARPTGPCALCGQSSKPVVYHSEDYGKPYLFSEPATYAICRSGHALIHLRFRFPKTWEAFKEHLRHGGSCTAWAKRRRTRQRPGHVEIVRRAGLTGSEWWEQLTLDPASLTAPWARPRGAVEGRR